MKKIIGLLLISLFIISACQPKGGGTVKLLGKVENPTVDSLTLQSAKGFSHSFKLTKENTFSGEIEVKEGYYTLHDGKVGVNIFLKPGFDLNIKVDIKNFDKTLTFTGKGATENNYLAKKVLLEQNLQKVTFYGYYGKMEEKDFLKLADSVYNVKLKLLKEQRDLDKDFYYLSLEDLDFEKKIWISSYEYTHAYIIKNDKFKVSKDFPDVTKDLDLNNEKLLVLRNYQSLLFQYVTIKAKKESQNDEIMNYLTVIEKDFTNEKVKDELAYQFTYDAYNVPKDIDKVFAKFKAIEKNEIYIKKVTEKFDKLKKIVAGMPSPTFSFPDIDGKKVSLEELKGKLVYIDVWATWCGPCRGELPHLKKLEEDYHGKDIYFVSICHNDEKASWEKMVKGENLKGVQLYAPKGENKFFQDYLINGIPHFILLDKEGKIIESNAKRPSNPELRSQLDKFLK